MAKKATPKKKRRSAVAKEAIDSLEAPPPSELASMVIGCNKDRAGLSVLADYIEEKLTLPATAVLLRSADLRDPPKTHQLAGTFQYYPLSEDVFLWLAECSYYAETKTREPRFGLFLGLYAHPAGRRKDWVKIVRVFPFALSQESDPHHSWLTLPEKDLRVEGARTELAPLEKEDRT